MENWQIATNEELIDWNKGASESTLFAVTAFLLFGIFILLGRSEILVWSPTALLYTILMAMAILTNIGSLYNFRTSKENLTRGILWGLVAWLILQIAGFIINLAGLTLLEIPVVFALPYIFQYILPPLTTLEKLAFQLTFVAFSEELLYRNTLPRIFHEIFHKYLKIAENTSIGISFVGSAALFGFVHFAAYNWNPIQIALAFLAGGIFSLFRIWKKDDGGIWICVFAHVIYNVTNMIGIFPTAGPEAPFTILY